MRDSAAARSGGSGGRIADPWARWAVRVRQLAPPRLGHAALLAALAVAIDFLRLLAQLPDGAPVFSRLLPDMGAQAVTMALLLVGGVTLAQAAPVRGWRRAVLIVAAGALAVLLGTLLRGMLPPRWNYVVEARIVSSMSAHLMNVAWVWTAFAVGIAVLYVVQERDAELAALARDAELGRLQAQRTVMEAGLKVIQAQVEPEFLFGALDAVQKLYTRDPDAAGRMIDALIVYLRAALPQMRGGTPTVGAEVELARSYAAVLEAPREGSFTVAARVGDDVRDVALPPMILLPVVQAAFADGAVDLRRRVAIEARRAPAAVAIRIEVDGGPPPEDWRGDGPETARRTLAACFGSEARLAFASIGDRHRAEIVLGGPAASGSLP